MKTLLLTIATIGLSTAVILALGDLRKPRSASARDASISVTHGVLAPAPPMSAARAAHTATALPDGRILVAGGFVESGSARGAEVYAADAGSVAPLPSMIATRHSHTATLLTDGRVLLVGGYGEGAATLASAEVFDPVKNSFAPTGTLLGARAGHIAILLSDGKVLIAGGVGPGWSFLSSAEIYDPATASFTATGGMSVARESHVGMRLLDGRALVVGGHRGRRADITVHASAEIYDPMAGVFSKVGDMGHRRHKHDGVLLPDGQVLITGGSDERDDRGMYDSSELFDPKTATFIAGPTMNLARHKHVGTSLVLANGIVLVAGGAPQAETFDPRSHRFELVGGELRMAGQFSAAAPLRKGGALITGGYGNGGGPRTTAWVFQP